MDQAWRRVDDVNPGSGQIRRRTQDSRLRALAQCEYNSDLLGITTTEAARGLGWASAGSSRRGSLTGQRSTTGHARLARRPTADTVSLPSE